MVKQGNFTVELVRAITKVPFPEHNKGGATYVEAEQDQEYFIKLHVHCPGPIQAVISVDGKSFDCSIQFAAETNAPGYFGKWECNAREGKQYEHALKFAKKRTRDDDEQASSESLPPFKPGRIDVYFYEAWYSGYNQAPKDCSEDWNGGDAGFVESITDPDKEKTVKTEVGTKFDAHPINDSFAYYKRGQLIDTVTLYYCSAKALVDGGITKNPKVTTFDYYRENKPYEGPANVTPPKTVLEEREMVVCGHKQTVKFEAIDLTGDDD